MGPPGGPPGGPPFPPGGFPPGGPPQAMRGPPPGFGGKYHPFTGLSVLTNSQAHPRSLLAEGQIPMVMVVQCHHFRQTATSHRVLLLQDLVVDRHRSHMVLPPSQIHRLSLATTRQVCTQIGPA